MPPEWMLLQAMTSEERESYEASKRENERIAKIKQPTDYRRKRR